MSLPKPLLQRVTRDGCLPEISRPDPAKVLAGDPVHTTWNLEEAEGLYCGLWQSTPASGGCPIRSGNTSTSTPAIRS